MSPISWIKLNRELAAIVGIGSGGIALLVSFGWSFISPNVRLLRHAESNKQEFTMLQNEISSVRTTDSVLLVIVNNHEQSQRDFLDSLIRIIEPIQYSACVNVTAKDKYLALHLKCAQLIAQEKSK